MISLFNNIMNAEELGDEILKYGDVVFLTGAGISSNAGIPTFRGKNGLWSYIDPEKFTIEYFMKNPEEWWSISFELFDLFLNVSPTPSHYAIAQLEKMGIVKAVITQNIDGLHKKAGSKNVIELHGNVSNLKCIFCQNEYRIEDFLEGLREGKIPKCPKCGNILKTGAILFDEEIPRKELLLSIYYASTCKMMIIVGTSLLVYPAASLPYYAKKNNSKIVYINKEIGEYVGDFDYIQEDSDKIIPMAVKHIKEKIEY